MIDQLILPLSSNSGYEQYAKADEEYTDLVSTWINTRTQLISEIWSKNPSTNKKNLIFNPSALADNIVDILTQRVFNFQSKIKLGHLFPSVRKKILEQIINGAPIKFFLLYNGGYRASSLPDNLYLIFEPDQTEVMLLYQIALLNRKISELYEPGIEFSIVINNGVALWVNNIPLNNTERYANLLRGIIDILGAHKKVSLLVQSELQDFNPHITFDPLHAQGMLSNKEHGIVERFLGRKCSREEAMFRSAIYQLAESKWENDLTPLAETKEVIMLRQIAHPNMLSFRPYPGGAIRTQNGTFGFHYKNNFLKPKLITSRSVKEYGLTWVPYHFPWIKNMVNGN